MHLVVVVAVVGVGCGAVIIFVVTNVIAVVISTNAPDSFVP